MVATEENDKNSCITLIILFSSGKKKAVTLHINCLDEKCLKQVGLGWGGSVGGWMCLGKLCLFI